MKNIYLVIVILVLTNINLYSKNINIKGVNISIVLNELPSTKKQNYKFIKLHYTSSDYDIIMLKLTKELNKYPVIILKKYAPNKIYIVNNIVFKNKNDVNGLSINNTIILSKKILVGGYSAYEIRTLHHEFFHQITYKYYNKHVKTLYKTIQHNSTFKYTKNTIEENDVYTYNSEFVTTYHPNSSETAAEIFSYLMYTSNLDPHTTLVIKWYNSTKSINNIKLKTNIAAVINFTAAISNNTLNNKFYLNLIK